MKLTTEGARHLRKTLRAKFGSECLSCEGKLRFPMARAGYESYHYVPYCRVCDGGPHDRGSKRIG